MKYYLSILLLLVVGCGEKEQAENQPSEKTDRDAQQKTEQSPEETIAALEKLGAEIRKDDDGNVEAVGFRRIAETGWKADDDGNVDIVGFRRTQFTDADLEHLKSLTSLKVLFIEYSKITDAGLEHLVGLTELQALNFNYTEITDAGLEHLKGLTNLKGLYLDGTKISDAGLVHLEGLTELKELSLDYTQITDAGIARLQKSLPHVQIDSDSNQSVRSAKKQLLALYRAIDHYQIDMNSYPDQKVGLKALQEPPEGSLNWNGRYSKRGVPQDPWGNEYFYELLLDANKQQYFKIWSAGPNKKNEEGSGDDIVKSSNQ